VDFLLYTALLLGAGLHHQFANAIGYASGTALSFLANALLNFKTSDRLLLRFVSFCGVGFLGWCLSASLLYVFVDCWGANKLIAKLATIAGVVLLQYNLNRLLSFRKSPPAAHG
jgi:putative flippase GtrA